MALLRFDGLSFAYPYATRRTLQNVSFEMAEGEYLVLCGPSGCGKTTLLKQRSICWTQKWRSRKSAMSSRIRRIRS